jgi:hypothetical protein
MVMKRPNENKVDKLFKDGFAGSENNTPFREADWAAMERLLDKKSGKRTAIYKLMYYASGIAAVLLLLFGLYLFAGKQDQDNANNRKKLTKNRSDRSKKHNDRSGQIFNNPVSRFPVDTGLSGNYSLHSRKSKSFFPLSTARKSRYPDEDQLPQSTAVVPVKKDSATTAPEPLLAQSWADVSRLGGNTPDTAVIAYQPKEEVEVKIEEKKNINPQIKRRPQITLSILAAPDLNSAGAFGAQMGSNIGLQLGIKLTRRLSVVTGVAYANKPYNARGFEYGNSFSPPESPSDVAANCKVLDIPLNISYQVFGKGKNTLAFGTGLSSYLMLREHYRFDYDNNPALEPFRLDIANQNKHWFGVLNINATFQRRINSKFSAVAQPYLKLPLTGIGNGNVNLRSAGVALGVNWNINVFGKPK